MTSPSTGATRRTRAARMVVVYVVGAALFTAGMIGALVLNHQQGDQAKADAITAITSSPVLEVTVVESSRSIGEYMAAAPARASDGRSGFLAGVWVTGDVVDAYAVTPSGQKFTSTEAVGPGEQLMFLAVDQVTVTQVASVRPLLTPLVFVALLCGVGMAVCVVNALVKAGDLGAVEAQPRPSADVDA
jgi:hypothetical protein